MDAIPPHTAFDLACRAACVRQATPHRQPRHGLVSVRCCCIVPGLSSQRTGCSTQPSHAHCRIEVVPISLVTFPSAHHSCDRTATTVASTVETWCIQSSEQPPAAPAPIRKLHTQTRAEQSEATGRSGLPNCFSLWDAAGSLDPAFGARLWPTPPSSLGDSSADRKQRRNFAWEERLPHRTGQQPDSAVQLH